MVDIDPSDASRDLQEARATGQEAATAMVQKRSRWALYGIGVFAASVLVWLSNPEWSNLISVALLLVAVAAALLARSPRWGGLTGQRARLTGAARRRARTLALATMLGALALFALFNTAVQLLLEQSYPIAGALVGLVLVTAGPAFARWWMTDLGSRR